MSNYFSSGGGYFGGTRRGYFGSSRRGYFGGSTLPSYGQTQLDPLALQNLQRSLAGLNLGQEPQPSRPGGFLSGIGRAVEWAIPGDAFASRALEQIAQGLIYTPVGLYYMGKAGVTDVKNIASPDFWASGKPMHSELGEYFGEMAHAIGEDIRHPLRNPGYLALDAWAIASLGAGAVSRLSRASRAAGQLKPPPAGPLIPEGAPLPPRGPSPALGKVTGAPHPSMEVIPSTFKPRETALQRELSLMAKLDDPGEVAGLADSIFERVSREKPSSQKFQDYLDIAAPRGSERQHLITQALSEAAARGRAAATAAPPRPPVQTPLFRPSPLAAEAQIPGQLSIPEFHKAFSELKPFPEEIGKPQFSLPPSDLQMIQQLEQLAKSPGFRELSEEGKWEALMRGTQLSEEEMLAAIRQVQEKGAGLTQQRQQVAREVTGAAEEQKAIANLFEEVGFKPIQVERPAESVARARFTPSKPYDDPQGRRAIRILDSEDVTVSRQGRRPKDTGVSVRQIGDRDAPTPTIPVRGQPSRPVQKIYRVFDEGVAVSDPITNAGDAVRLAQLHAAEKASGISPKTYGLSIGNEPIGMLGEQAGALAQELGKGQPILARDALDVAREQVRRRKERRKGQRKQEMGSLEEVDEIIGGDQVAPMSEVDEILGTQTAPRSDVPAETPIEQTPPLKQEYVEQIKEDAPEEIHDVIDEIFEAAEEPVDIRPEARPGGELRQAGISDRALGINPRALDRAGLSREQGNKLREPLKELYGSGIRVTPEDVQRVIAETLPVEDAEAARIFEALRGAKGGRETDVKLRPGSLSGHFRELWNLDEAQAAAAADRFKESLQNFRLRENRAPKRRDLEAMLEEVFGPEKGKEAFARLYEVKGGSGETAAMVFLREFFKTPPRERYVLSQEATRTVTESRLTPRYRVTKEGKREVSYRPKRSQRSETIREGVSIDLSRNPVRKAFQRWYYDWLQQAPEGSRGARARARKIKFEKTEIARLEDYLAEAGMTREQIDQMKPPVERGASVGDYVDTMNQLAQIGVLYLKPAYVPPNLLGQILFTTIDHSWNPIAIARSASMQGKIAKLPNGRKLVELIRAGMGEGMYQGIAPERGASKKVARVHGALARAYGRVLDIPFRDASFFNEAHRYGYTTPQQIARLLEAKPGEPMYRDLVSIFRNANRNIVDYGRLSNTEKMLIRRVVFFYPWIKGSTIWAARTASEHPAQVAIMTQAAREGAERTEEILGPVPSYMRGIIPIGERDVPGIGKTPRIINPTAFSVTGSAGESLNALRALLFGGTTSEQLSEYFTPALGAGIAAATRTDPFTGRSYNQGESSVDIFRQEIGQNIPFIRALQNIPPAQKALGLEPGKQGLIESGQLNAADTLMPTTRGEELLRFFGGTTPVTYNIKEGQERAIAEDLELRGSGEGAMAKWKQTETASLEAAQSVGALRKGESFPSYVTDALRNQAQRDRMYELVASSNNTKKSNLRQIDKLRADLQVVVQQGRMSQGQAMQLLLQYSNYDDTGISYFRRKLADTYFGLPQLYAYRRTLIQRGVDERTLNAWDSP